MAVRSAQIKTAQNVVAAVPTTTTTTAATTTTTTTQPSGRRKRAGEGEAGAGNYFLKLKKIFVIYMTCD
jgi:hypothetical protein